jgi:hypothetical protein
VTSLARKRVCDRDEHIGGEQQNGERERSSHDGHLSLLGRTVKKQEAQHAYLYSNERSRTANLTHLKDSEILEDLGEAVGLDGINIL